LKARGGRRKRRPARAAARGARRSAKVQRRKKRRRYLTAKSPPKLPQPPLRDQLEQLERPPARLGLLELAVPLWIDRLRPLPWEERLQVRDGALARLGASTDDPGKLTGIAGLADPDVRTKPGQVAGAFNALAQALALGALQPGGVSFAGMHWEAAP
jgi:hypothetical protein